MSDEYNDDLFTQSTIDLKGDELRISSSGYVSQAGAVYIFAGPFGMSLTVEKAIELGNEIIRVAHHYRAANAALQSAPTADPAEAVQP